MNGRVILEEYQYWCIQEVSKNTQYWMEMGIICFTSYCLYLVKNKQAFGPQVLNTAEESSVLYRSHDSCKR